MPLITPLPTGNHQMHAHRACLMIMRTVCMGLAALVCFAGIPHRALAAPPVRTVTLHDTIMATLNTYREIKAMQANRQAARHELRRSQAGWGPRVEITAGGGGSSLSEASTRQYGSDQMETVGNVGAVVTQPLWNGWATSSRVWVSTSQLASLDKRLLDNATTYALDGIIAHIDLIRRRHILTFAEENVQRHQETLAAQRQRLKAGASSVADVTQTEGRLARAISTLSDVRSALHETAFAYERTTGNPAPSALETVTLPQSMFATPDTVLTLAKIHNPKVGAYLADINVASGEQAVARSAYHPTINLEAGPRYADRSGRGSQWVSSLDAMVVMRWNVFNSGADDAAVQAAAAKKRQVREEMFNFMDSLTQEINSTWVRYVSAQEQAASYAKAMAYNQQTLTVFLEQFVLGQRSLIDVLDAEAELFNSSTQHATACGNILVGAYRLYALSGTLLPTLGIDTSFLYAEKDIAP